jgi:hypothetical protein
LFDLVTDPEERKDVSAAHPELVAMLLKQLGGYSAYVSGTMSKEDLRNYDCFGTDENNTMWGPPTYKHTFVGPCCKRKQKPWR